jgi:hypothetical protein
LALPSETTLQTKYAARILQLQDNLTDLPRIEEAMADYIGYYALFPQFLLCTLCIGAFTVGPNSPKLRRFVSDIQRVGEKTADGSNSEANNSFFLI